MRYAVETDYRLFFRNLVQYKWFLTIMFCVIALGFAAFGFFQPKTYASYSTLLVDGKTMIAPLMEGAAVSSANNNWAKVAEEIVHSRKTMTSLMQSLGDIEGEISTNEQEVRLEQLQRNTFVSLDGDNNYLQIEYRDEDPYQAKLIAEHLTNIFIGATHGYRSEESKEAFDFIDKQAKQYHEKLQAAEERLKEFKTKKLESGASTEVAVSTRIENLQEVLDSAQLELKEAISMKAALERQLTGEVKATISLSRQSVYMDRLNALQDELSQLRLTYHENYPDIVNLKHQIANVKKSIEREKNNSTSDDTAGVEDGFKANEVYQGLRLQLSEVETRIATLSIRVQEAKRIIDEERAKGDLVHASDATLIELTRDYDVNKKIYEDLIKRRETARVSMDIDAQHKGLNIKVYEPAFLPLKPHGFRFLHFLIAGVIVGFMVPASLIYGYQMIDTTVKSPELVQKKMDVPVLGMVPPVVNKRDVLFQKSRNTALYMLILLTMIALAAISYLKIIQAD